MPGKALSTQGLVNTYPLWSRIRSDEQSAGYQYFNHAAGQHMDYLRKQVDRIGVNYFLSSAIVSDIDVYYKFNLPKNYVFQQSADDTDLSFQVPTVSGLIDDTYYNINLPVENTVECFWYQTPPTRITIDDTVIGTTTDHLVASGHVNTRLYPIVDSGIITHPNCLTLTLSGADLCLDLQNNLPVVGHAKVYGTTRAGQEVVEDLVLLHDGVQQTIYEYALVSGVFPYGISPVDANLTVTSWRRSNTSIGESFYYKTAYTLGRTIDNFEMPLFWMVNGPDHTLELHKYDADDPELRLDGYADKSVWDKYELVSMSGQQITPNDMAVEPWSEWLWVVDNQNLYLFDDELYYPDTTSLVSKNYDAPATIHPSSYVLVSGETVDLEYVWDRPTVGLVRHRTWVEKPDGNKYSLEDGSEVTYHSDSSSWIVEEPHGRYIKPTETYTLDQRGQYTYILQTYFTDRTTYTDKRIISVNYKEPRASFFLPAAGIHQNILSVDIDSENQLWIFGADGTRYQIGKHYDVMLIDIDKKVLYFSEPYSQIRVLGGT